MLEKNLIQVFENRYNDYLKDESKMKGKADSISFPTTEDEVKEIVRELSQKEDNITVQGSKTGICGGAVPSGGHIMSMTKLNKIVDEFNKDGHYFVTIEAGCTLEDLEKYLYKKGLFWPVEPTEKLATIGGIISTNAKGIGAYYYGRVVNYITEITYVNYTGEVITIDEKDSVFDSFIGSEGMYGIIVKATIRVIPKPKEIWGIGFFFRTIKDCLLFTEEVKKINPTGESAIVAIEYFDKMTLKYINKLKEIATKLSELPSIEESINSIIYIEIHGESEEAIEEVAEQLMVLAMEHNSDPDEAWALSIEDEIDKIHIFRHGAAEAINVEVEQYKRIDKRITKLGTDMVSHKPLGELLDMYYDDCQKAGLDVAVFGHIGSHHLHANIISKDYEQYTRGITVIRKWAEVILESEGKIITEHGVGKLKKGIFLQSIDKETKDHLSELKRQFDPKGLFNKENMLD